MWWHKQHNNVQKINYYVKMVMFRVGECLSWIFLPIGGKFFEKI